MQAFQEIQEPDIRIFDVTITETSRTTITIEADDADQAERIVRDRWDLGDYILDDDDFIAVEFKATEIGANLPQI